MNKQNEWVVFGYILESLSNERLNVRAIHVEERMTDFYATRQGRKIKALVFESPTGAYMG